MNIICLPLGSGGPSTSNTGQSLSGAGQSLSGTALLSSSDNFGESAVQELVAMGFPREQV